ncbi:hypothetical protein [[Pseudomonas] boreopolis]|uniref:hypothetical protein n=1 Tax=Xanthomonas boreopolis TaxID=86183 RepID=UPI003D9B5FE8
MIRTTGEGQSPLTPTLRHWAALFFVTAYMVLPQFFLRLGEQLSIIDLLAPVVLLAAFIRRRLYLPSAAKLLIAFIAYFFAIYGVRGIVTGENEYWTQAPYLFRMLFILCPAFIGFYMPGDRRLLARALRVSSFLAILALTVILVAYAMGTTMFDATQTFDFAGDGQIMHRLGGLPGETGAFAFNALYVCEVALVALVFNSRRRVVGILLFIFVCGLLVAGLRYSLARVMILNFISFLMVVFLFSRSSISKKILVFFVLIIGGVGLSQLTSLSSDYLSVVLERFAGGASNINSLSSGRVSHWEDALVILGGDMSAVLFGIGNRMSNPFMGHVTENLFINVLLEYGVVGSVIFFSFLYKFLQPVVRSALRGDSMSVGFFSIWIATFVHWQINDVITYYQTFPVLLFVTAWLSRVISNDQTNINIGER